MKAHMIKKVLSKFLFLQSKNFGSVNMAKVKIAVIQLAVSSCKNTNLTRISQLVKEASQNNSKIVLLPECCNSPYGVKHFPNYAESIPGQTSATLSEIAKNNSVYLIGGSFPESSDGKLYNTSLSFDPQGELIGKFRKIHLFDIDVPGKITFKESDALSPGNELTILNTPYCKIGVGICYDIRFPELANIYSKEGCDMIVYPGAFNMTTGPAHWELLLRARAVDNQVYIAGIAPARDEKADYTSWGHSSIVSPWGDVLAKADETEQILYAEFDVDYIKSVRQQIPVLQQKRCDMYKVENLSKM